MTEQTKDDIVKGEGEALVPPTPTISAGSEQAGSKETGFDAVAFEERITAKIEQLSGSLPTLVDARFKSVTDKSFQDVKKVASYLKKFDGNEELAIREMAIDRLLEREKEAGDPGRSPAQGTQVAGSEFARRTAEILEEAGIPLDDPEVLELQKSPVANEGDWYRKLTRLGIKRAKQSGIAPSAIVAPSGSAARVSADEKEIADELQAIQQGAKGSPFSTENKKRRAELIKQLNEIQPMVDVEDPDLKIDMSALRQGW